MKKEDKNLVIEALGAQLAEYSHFYLVNIEGLDAAKTSELRRACFKQDIKLLVAKNTLLQKALEKKGVEAEIFAALKGNTALMLSNTGNAPAKLIKEFTKGDKTGEAKPELKAAYVEETVYVGKQNLAFLATIKSKNELVPRYYQVQERTYCRIGCSPAIACEERRFCSPERSEHHPWCTRDPRETRIINT